MSIVLIHNRIDLSDFKTLLQKELPNTKIELLAEVENPDEVEYAISWNHPKGLFKSYKNLKVIASFGAGVDHILSDKELPKNIEITKVVNHQLSKDMSDFVLMQCLNYIRNTHYHIQKQREKNWDIVAYTSPKHVQVGILGLGTLGKAVAEALVSRNFKVSGWATTKKTIKGVESYAKEELNTMLNKTNILICLLPLTPETKGILNKKLFTELPDNSCLINVARGQHLNEEDLKQAIQSNKIEAAFLDVTNQEPLPENHWLWHNHAVHITPHIASVSEPSEVVSQLAENYIRFKKGEKLKNLIKSAKGY